MKKIMILLLAVIMTGFAFAATAQDILAEVASNYENLNDAKATISLTKKDGSENLSSDFCIYVFKKDENTRYSIVRFLSPREKKNITLLAKGQGETYMYMPALRSVKKMQAASENEKFADSDFTYGELSLLYKISAFAEKATIYSQNDEEYGIEIRQENKALAYSSMRIKIAKDKMLPEEVYFYDWENKPSKVIRITDYREIEGKMVPWSITATDYNTKGKTTISFREISLDMGMNEDFFTPKSISRSRLKY